MGVLHVVGVFRVPAASYHQHRQDFVLQLLCVQAAAFVGDRGVEDFLDGVSLQWLSALGDPVTPVVFASQPSEEVEDGRVVLPVVFVDRWSAVAGEYVVKVSEFVENDIHQISMFSCSDSDFLPSTT